MGTTAETWNWWDGNNGNSVVGATMAGHAATDLTNVAQVQVADHNHLATRDLPDTYGFGDEHYNFRRNVRGTHHVLATLDERTYTPGGNAMGQDHPVTWCKLYDGDNINDNTGVAEDLQRRPHVGHLDGPLRRLLHGERRQQQPDQDDRRRRPLGRGRGPQVRLLGHRLVVVHAHGRSSPTPTTRSASTSPRTARSTGRRSATRSALTSTGYVKMHDPAKPAGNKTTVISIPTRADHGNSEDGVLGMSLQPGFDLADPNKRNIFVYYSPRNAGLADHRQRPGRRLQPDQPLHADRRRHRRRSRTPSA